MSGELVSTKTGEILALDKEPQAVLDQARVAAIALKNAIAKKEKPVIFNGKQYPEYSDWQLLGEFYGYSVKTGEAAPIEVNGIQGAKAVATLYNKSGVAVGGAEAYCMRDEPNWAKKPWPQLASMAQTRAGAKSYRNRLGWIMVLAGCRDTPAEELHVGDVAPPMVRMPVPLAVPEIGKRSFPDVIPVTSELGGASEQIYLSGVQKDPGVYKNGKNAGKPYVRYSVIAQDGQKFSTFEEADGEKCREAAEAGLPVKIAYEINKGYKNIKSVDVIVPVPGDAQEQE